jgi:ketosteroid isomerase-like protein
VALVPTASFHVIVCRLAYPRSICRNQHDFAIGSACVVAGWTVHQHKNGAEMSESYSLPTEPEGVVPSLLERFNSGKVSAMMTLSEPEAVLIAKDGRTVTGHTEIAAQLEPDLKYGLPLDAKARHVFVAGDIAEIVLDWSIDGTGPDGKHVHVGGSASDVVHRGADGFWRYVIDNNLGTAVRQPA